MNLPISSAGQPETHLSGTPPQIRHTLSTHVHHVVHNLRVGRVDRDRAIPGRPLDVHGTYVHDLRQRRRERLGRCVTYAWPESSPVRLVVTVLLL